MVYSVADSKPFLISDRLLWHTLIDTNQQQATVIVNPLDARRRYTDFAQTSIRAGLRYTVRTACYRMRRQTVYLRYGV